MKIKLPTGIIDVACPPGYRRVSNGYTRDGDKAYAPENERTSYGEWEPLDELQLVSEFLCVIRPKAGES